MVKKVKIELVAAQRYMCGGVLYVKDKVYPVEEEQAEYLLDQFRNGDIPYFRMHRDLKAEAEAAKDKGRRRRKPIPKELANPPEAAVVEEESAGEALDV